MALKGYLAALTNVPPLVFRFQINPTVLSEKRTFKWEPVQEMPKAGFDKAKGKTAGKSGFGAVVGGIAGVVEDVKEWGALLTSTKPLQHKEGDPRVIELEFDLDTTFTEPDGSTRWGEATIEPDLELLRSFVNPGFALTDLPDVFQGNVQCNWKPPEVSLKYGSISMTGVMTDLNIKVVAFKEDGSPQRATVTTVIKEQSKSFGSVTNVVSRYVTTTEALLKTPLEDIAAASPIGPFLE
jgi:hypothetical protein